MKLTSSQVDSNDATLQLNGSLIVGASEDQNIDSSYRAQGGQGAISFNLLSYFTVQHSSNAAAGTWINIRTPFRPDVESKMFHFTVKGYAFALDNTHHVIDLRYVGYARNGGIQSPDVWDATMARGLANGYFEPAMYKGSDGHVWLRFWVQDKYYMSYRVDSMFVGNGRIVRPGELSQVTAVAIPGNEQQ